MSLDLWIDFFDDLEHVRGRSKNTIMAYRRDLELYGEFVKLKRDIHHFYEFMEKKKLSPRSQARVISSVRTYLKFCESKGMQVPRLDQLRQPKVKVALPKAISVEDFQRLYDNCGVEGNVYRTARNQMTLLMLFGLGCRVSELIDLNLQDFNETDAWLSVLGKGGKQRLVPLTDNLLKELTDYLRQVRPRLVKDDSCQSILINDRGKRPSRVDIWRWLAAWSNKAGFPEPISPHKFRHGCATALLEGGADLRSIQMLLGHSSIQTTQIYTSVTSKKLKSEIDEHHPLSNKDK
tara:strand:+ start:17450 stop:18325 length:876 start_codon:yes stop_codon:yes gene_type:complete